MQLMQLWWRLEHTVEAEWPGWSCMQLEVGTELMSSGEQVLTQLSLCSGFHRLQISVSTSSLLVTTLSPS